MTSVTRLCEVMQLLRNRLSRDLPIQQVALLLTVSENPGITMQELMQVLEMPQGTVSRNVKALSHSVTWQNGMAVPRGYGLLRTQPCADNRHMLAVFLTGRGEVLVEDITRLLAGNEVSGDGAMVQARDGFAEETTRMAH